LEKGNPVENAIVSINTSSDLKSVTDSDGKFKILNVPKGNYEITASKALEDGSFSERTSIINVDGDTEVSNLILPKGVTLLNPENVTDISMDIY
jgi:hypothetical protein